MDGMRMTDKSVKEQMNLFKCLQMRSTITLILTIKAFQLTNWVVKNQKV
jgi:hypothetical protein